MRSHLLFQTLLYCILVYSNCILCRYDVFEYLVIHCLHLNHNTMNSVRKKVGSGKLGKGMAG